MHVAVVGSDYLTIEQLKSATAILDAFLCRYATGSSVLITRGYEGVEEVAKRLSEAWGWAGVVYYKPTQSRPWNYLSWRKPIEQIAQDCDVLICVNDRYPERRNPIANKARKLGKKVIEVFV